MCLDAGDLPRPDSIRAACQAPASEHVHRLAADDAIEVPRGALAHGFRIHREPGRSQLSLDANPYAMVGRDGPLLELERAVYRELSSPDPLRYSSR